MAGQDQAMAGVAGRVVPLRATQLGGTPEGRRIAALRRRLDRLRRESIRLCEQAADADIAALRRRTDDLRGKNARLRERAAALGLASASESKVPVATGAARPEARVETLREELLQVRARIRALEARAQADLLPAAAIAKLVSLRRRASQLWDDLRQVTREDIPADPD